MNETFGPENHVATFIWKRRTATDSRNLNGISGDHEYILCYQRTAGFRVQGQAKDLGKYKNPDNDMRGPWMSDNLTGLANPAERPNLHYEIVNPKTGIGYQPHPSRGWLYGRERMAELVEGNRILWPRKREGRPRLKRFISDMQSETTGFSTILDAPGNVVATKELAEIMRSKAFAFPKPSGLIGLLIEQATSPGDLVLDSFAGSGTTGHAVLALNKQHSSNRHFILVEMEPKIAPDITAERVRRVAQGYKNAKGEKVEGLGGGFRYCELGEPLFDQNGKIRESVTFAELARHVYFTETGEPLPRERVSKSPFLGECRRVGIYLLYNGILDDQSAKGGNVLTRAVLAKLPKFDGQKVIYCAGCLLGKDRLQAERILVRQTPYEIKVS